MGIYNKLAGYRHLQPEDVVNIHFFEEKIIDKIKAEAFKKVEKIDDGFCLPFVLEEIKETKELLDSLYSSEDRKQFEYLEHVMVRRLSYLEKIISGAEHN